MARLSMGFAAICLSAAAFAIPAAAQSSNITGLFTFCDAGEYGANFVELRGGPQITPSTGDLGRTGHCALNFTGRSGSAGDTWITRYDGGSTGCLDQCIASEGGPVFAASRKLCLSADILISPFNNAKGAGLVAMLGTDGGPGLFVQLVNNGNTDRIALNTIDPATGKIALVVGKSIGGAGIAENAWYSVSAFIQSFPPCSPAIDALGGDLQIMVWVYSHAEPSDPDSGWATLLGSIVYVTSLADIGLSDAGFVGIAGWAKSATLNTSVTNFIAYESCT